MRLPFLPIPPPATVDSVEDLIKQTRATRETQVYDADLRRELEKTEELLVVWLVKIATKELKQRRVFKTEYSWIRRIARFYHAYVPFLKSYYKLQDPDRTDTNVFVSHTGDDNPSYATPLANYLKNNQVKNVFIDKQDIESGSIAAEEMLRAAVTCRTFWCVLSRSFVQKKWPMRELMIGFARHLQETRSGGFCLFIDCFEQSRSIDGAWMERIAEMETIQPYDEYDEMPRPLPGNMEPVRAHESFDERYARLGAKVIKGCTRHHTRRASSTLAEEKVWLHKHFPTDDFCRIMARAKRIRFLNTWIPNLPSFVGALSEALTAGASVEFLLLSAYSPYRESRNRALSMSNQPFLRDPVKAGIEGNLEMIDVICNSVGFSSCEAKKRVQVRLYDSLPSISIFQADERVYIGKYLHGKLSIKSILFETTEDSELGLEAMDEMRVLWECASLPETVERRELQRQLMTYALAVLVVICVIFCLADVRLQAGSIPRFFDSLTIEIVSRLTSDAAAECIATVDRDELRE